MSGEVETRTRAPEGEATTTAPAAAGDPNRILVFLRIRPKNDRDGYDEGATDLMAIQSDRKALTVEGTGKPPYSFDHVWDGKNVCQEDVFNQVGKPVVQNVFQGYWGTNLVYGQTGTGKSFSMSGPEDNLDPKLEGIIPRTMRYVFDRVAAEAGERKYTISFSYLQIYLDRLGDLFNPEGPELKLTRDKDGVSFPGIVEHTVTSNEDFTEKYEDGSQYRVISATKINPVSSRGHAALFIQIKSVPANDPAGEVRNGKLFLVDLAGYERFSKTGVQEGVMKEEAKTINTSLMALGTCVSALSEKADYVPWRNVKLTRMLEDAIGGKAKCSMLLTAGPSSDHLHETLGTLNFGARAMSVKTNATVKAKVDFQLLSKKLQEELSLAKTSISALELQVQNQQQDTYQQVPLAANVTDAAEAATLAAGVTSNPSTSLVARLHKDLATAQTQAEKAKSENRRVQTELAELRLSIEMAGDVDTTHVTDSTSTPASPTSSPAPAAAGGDGSPATRNLASLNSHTVSMKKEVQRRVDSVRVMLEETYALKLAEVEEPLLEEVSRYKGLYETLKLATDDHLTTTKDVLGASYEDEIQQLKKTSLEVQEKLKKNHAVIKRSYQNQLDQLKLENSELRAELLKAIGAGSSPSSPSASPRPQTTRPGAASLAETLLMRKQAERKVSELESQVKEMLQEKEQMDLALKSPSHFRPAMSPVLGEYLPYLLSCHGDGVGRSYRMSSENECWFAQLQLKLAPFTTSFSSLPSPSSGSSSSTPLCWNDASYLLLDHAQLAKCGVSFSSTSSTLPTHAPALGSRAISETILQYCGPLTVRGILRQEGNFVYVALTAQSSADPSSGAVSSHDAVTACKHLMAAIHSEVMSCLSDSQATTGGRAVQLGDRLRIADSQDMVFTGWEAKRAKMDFGVETILRRFGVDSGTIQQQLLEASRISGGAVEIDRTLAMIPTHLKDF